MIRQLMSNTSNLIVLGFMWVLASVLFAMFVLHSGAYAGVTAYFTTNAAILFLVGMDTLSKGIAKDSRSYL